MIGVLLSWGALLLASILSMAGWPDIITWYDRDAIRRFQTGYDELLARRVARILEATPDNLQEWTTEDGRRIAIIDLTDAHLRNVIFHLQTRHRVLYPGARIEVKFPIYLALMREVRRRGLQ